MLCFLPNNSPIPTLSKQAQDGADKDFRTGSSQETPESSEECTNNVNPLKKFRMEKKPLQCPRVNLQNDSERAIQLGSAQKTASSSQEKTSDFLLIRDLNP